MVAKKIFSRIAQKHSGELIDKAIGTLVPDSKHGPEKTTFKGRIAGALLLRFATRSVPGAILVGGALLAKLAHDHLKTKREAAAAAEHNTIDLEPIEKCPIDTCPIDT